MALIASTLSFKQHPFLTFQSLNHNNSKTKTLSLNSKPHISKCNLSNGFTPNYPNSNSKYYLEDTSNITHNNKIKRNIWVIKTSTIPVPESESKSHRIWWSDVVVNYPKNVFGRNYKKWNSLDIVNICYMGGIHLLALFAPFTFTWERLLVAIVIGLVTGWLGITLSYHRHLAHKSFKLPKWLEYLFAYCGVLAFQGDPISWVNIHHYHHKFCDTDKDPHTPKKGFWFSHINWIFDTKAITNCGMPSGLSSESVDNAKSQELEGTTILDMLPSMDSLIALPKFGDTNITEDLEKQPFYRFIRSTYILHSLLLGLLLYGLGGYPYLVWGMGVRSICAYHITFLVNSAAHVWGYQSWRSGDSSKNNWWVALLTSGEGWHNNHHAFPYSARHGMEWWQIDFTWYAIKLLQILGLATDVKLPTEVHKKRLALKREAVKAEENSIGMCL